MVVVWRGGIKNTYGMVTTTAYVSHYFLNRENPFITRTRGGAGWVGPRLVLSSLLPPGHTN